jgi:transposase, IS5 family
MLGQGSFSDLEYANKKRRTGRELFLAEMEAVVPWPALLGVVEPHYPRTGGRGRRPVGLAAMLRIYFLQQWFALSDRQMEDALYDIESLRRFAGFSNLTAALPDETVLAKAGILNFRHLLERHDLPRHLLEAVNGLLKARGLLVSQGTMVDATIIHAPSSTKNTKGERDPEMHQTKKGKQWYFGMKIHIGADVDSGAVHSVSVTAANQADISELPHLLRETDRVVFGDAGYASDQYKRGARALGMVWRVQDKAKPKGSLGALRQPEKTQPEEFGDPGAGRASLPHPQAAVRLHQGALSRAEEEHRPGDDADQPGEFVRFAPQAGDGVDSPIASDRVRPP